ncbi:hypothetical protein FJ988_05400 [Mesorhizobium sp. CU3]|uniref:hypothetical protein n=1 Tax=unclassified Mesorhizobium TaxID=325217 RepID=UPI00112D2A57|nr:MULTISPECIES: hypothetical protein [unclassified Mesorhizobium]TPN88484.1 hypothetical protein FJ988_05400 [Mesorhizobium sp. CU3]
MRNFGVIATLIAGAPLMLQACAAPDFDVPKNSHGPTAFSIAQRITCELMNLVKDHSDPKDNYIHKKELLSGNYKVAVTMTLDVEDTGELAPTLAYTQSALFGLDAGFKASQTRTQEFSEDLLFSFQQMHQQWRINPRFGDCPDHNTLLAGDLGLKTLVDLGFSTPNRDTSAGQKDGEFGGYVNFEVVQNVNAFGPTWTLTHFKGPGGLATLGRTNTDKLTFGFAPQPDESHPPKTSAGKATNAKNQLEKVKLNSIDQLLTKLNLATQK